MRASINACVKASWVILAQNISIQIGYRLAFFQIAFFESLGLLGTLFYWRAAAASGERITAAADSAAVIPPYAVPGIVVYFMLSASHQILHESDVSRSLSLDIRSGKLAAAMVRPFPFILNPLMQGLAFSLSRIIMIAPVILLIFAVIPFFREFFEQVAAINGGWFWVVFYVLALTLAMIINLFMRIGLGLLAFDMTQTWGPDLLFGSIYLAFSGAVYPIDLLPGYALKILEWTPFYYLQGFPNLLASGRVSPDLFWGMFMRGVLVCGVMISVVIFMWRRGSQKFEAIGI